MEIETQHLKLGKQGLRAFVASLSAVIVIFFIIPIFEKTFYTHLVLQCSFSVLILSTIYALAGKPWSLALFFLVPFAFFNSVSFYCSSLSCLVISYGISVAFTLLAILILMRKIFLAHLINIKLIFCALMIYLLSGILWANFYFLVNALYPGSFDGVGWLAIEKIKFSELYEHYFNFLYYSFATLATLGMGDITPLHHLAKSLTAIEAMFGQLFVAIIIAKLVSAWWILPEGKRN